MSATRNFRRTSFVVLTLSAWVWSLPSHAQSPAAQQSLVWSDLVIPGGAEALLRAAGISPSIERWRAVPAVIEQFYGGLQARIPRSFRVYPETSGAQDSRAPLPLDAAFWEVALGRRYAAGELLSVILSTRAAASLYYGLLSMDTRTLEAVRSDARLAQVLITHGERLPVHARALRIRDGGIDPPGGATFAPLWEHLIAPLDRPAEFIQSLLTRDEGRLGYFYSTIDAMPASGQRFMAEAGDKTDRRARFKAFYEAFTRAMPTWQANERRFFPVLDGPGEALLAVDFTTEGALIGPASLRFWQAALTDEEPHGRTRTKTADPADLLKVLCTSSGCKREKIHTLAFIQRLVRRAPAATEDQLLAAAETRMAFPALALELERLHIDDLDIYPKARRAATAIDALSPNHRLHALLQFQGGVALLRRLRESGREAGEIHGMLEKLLTVPLNRDGYRGGVLRWFGGDVLGGAEGGALDDRAIRMLAGTSGASATVEWEGSRYQVNLAVTEASRLRAATSRFDGPGLDEAWRLLTEGESTAERAAAQAITRLVYAITVQDLSVPLAASRELPHKHEPLRRVPGEPGPPSWLLPSIRFGTAGRHVGGALLGLDSGVPEFASRRLDGSRPRERARISAILADGLLRASALTSVWTDSRGEAAMIAAAGARGAELARRPQELERSLPAAGIAGPRAGWIRWSVARGLPDPGDVLRLEDHVRLGRLETPLTMIGAADVALKRIGLQFPATTWEARGQPPDHHLAASLAVELPLRVAYELHTRALPTVFAPGVLSMLATDLVEGSALAHPADLHGIADSVRRIPSHRFDDYIAAVTARGPLLPVSSGGTIDR